VSPAGRMDDLRGLGLETSPRAALALTFGEIRGLVAGTRRRGVAPSLPFAFWPAEPRRVRTADPIRVFPGPLLGKKLVSTLQAIERTIRRQSRAIRDLGDLHSTTHAQPMHFFPFGDAPVTLAF